MSANGVDLAWMDGLLAGYLTSWLTCAVSLPNHSLLSDFFLSDDPQLNNYLDYLRRIGG